MADSRDELPEVPALRTLEPPPGGLMMLRERLDAAPRRRRWWLAAVPVAALAALALWVVQRDHSPPGQHRAPASHQLATTPAPRALLRDPDVARDVEFYWVTSTPHPARESSTPISSMAAAKTVSIDEAPQVAMIDL